jgi:L-ascorbate metabolism protein UlaG (beta-lactamase superfamily)
MSVDQPLFLNSNIQVEPLIDRWYAWPYLIPPATVARYITERHLKILDSYLVDPSVHKAAVKNPKMLGGPFIDCEAGRVEEIRELREHITTQRAHLIELSSALSTLDSLLRSKANGYSLHSLYSEVPEILRGYVELVYDLNNHPSFRIIEPLLYKSRYFDKSQQSLMLSPISKDERPFVLSTPRLDTDDCIHLRLAFDDPSIDKLFLLKSQPQPWRRIRDTADLTDDQATRLRSFFSPKEPACYKPYAGQGVRWRYFGHACILIESQGISMLFDPVLSYTYDSGISRYTYADLPDTIDYVLITHNHQDHVLFETLLQIRHKIRNILVPRNGGGHLQDPSLKLLLENCGFRNVTELSEMESVRDNNVEIVGLPFLGEHADLAIMTKLAWLVKLGPHSMLFAADSCNIEPRLYEHICRDIGGADALFLGMECDGAPLSWLYGALLTQSLERTMDQSRRLSGSNFVQGMNIVDLLKCSEVYIYAMGQEPWLNYIMSLKYTNESRPIVESDRLLAKCHEKGIIAERLFGEREILIPAGQKRRQIAV